MTVLLRWIFLIPFAYIFACLAAAIMVALGVYLPYLGEEVAGYFAATVFIVLFWGGAFAAAPAAIAIVLAELFGWRSVFFWTLLGGAIAFAAHELAVTPDMLPTDNDYRLAYVAAGFVGGFVYWLLAGRLSAMGVGSGEGPKG